MHAEDAGVWPGYVAALAGLVQSLLLVAAVLAMLILQIGMISRMLEDEAQAKLLVESEAEKIAQIEEEKRLEQQAEETQIDRLQILFRGNALKIETGVREQLLVEINKRIKLGTRHWLLQMETDIDHPTKRRAGYLRLILIRNFLLESGIDPQDVDIRLLASTEPPIEALDQRIIISMKRPKNIPPPQE